MLSIKQVLCEMESCVSRLKLCESQNRFEDMSYLLGFIGGFSLILKEIINSKLTESAESSKGS